ncbi:MAG TPA: zf-HC2 domain-containing protein [bacterium]|nr:zf-HC2 domain-containing protein [bacterium]
MATMCPDRELLSALVDGEVPSPWSDAIERHVHGCESCAREVASLRHTHDLFAADIVAMDSAAARASGRVAERLRLQPPRSIHVEHIWSRRYAIPLPAAAAAAILMAVLSFALVQSSHRNADLRVAVQKAIEATPVSTSASGTGIESILDYLSRQNASVNVNITLPAGTYAGATGEPFIVREADYKPGSGR